MRLNLRIFENILLSICMTFTILANGTSSYEQQTILEGPEDQQATIGEQVTLKCRINNLRGEPQWCIDDFCLGFLNKDLESKSTGNDLTTLKGRPRHKIVGDKHKGEFHLLIEPVQLQDNMYYYCMATAASGNVKAIKSKRVFLTVLSKYF